MYHDSAPNRNDRQSFMFVGFAASAVVAVVDATSDSLVLIPLLVLAPLIACSGGSERGTLAVAVAASVVSVPLGWIDDIGGSRRHWVGVVTTACGGALAVWFARSREAAIGNLLLQRPSSGGLIA